MSRTNGAGQPSVDEILASIRASIAEEEVQPRPASVRSENFRAQPAEPAAHDGHEFDLPNIFRPTLQATPEKHTKLFGRLADALLGANGEASSELNGSRRIDLDAPPVSEPAPAKAAAPVEQPSAPAAAASASPDVQRVMAPFRDTRMSRLGGDGSSSSLGSPVAAPAPAPVAATPAPAPTPAASEPLAKGQWARPEPSATQSASDSGRGTGYGAAAPERPVHGLNGAHLNGAHSSSPHMDGPHFNGSHMNGAAEVFNGHGPLNGASANWSPQNAPVPPSPPQLAPRPVAVASPDVPDVARGGVEDAAAQLLRPMLRQWLSENMPKIVESALRSEAADAVGPGGKPPGRD